MMTFGAAIVAVLGLSSIVLAAPHFEALGRTVVEELRARSFDKIVERFDQKMLAALPKEKLAATWNSVISKAGAFKSVTAVRIQDLPQQGVHLVELTSAFEKMNVFIRVAFNDEGNIAGLFFSSAPLSTVQWTPPPYADPAALPAWIHTISRH